jgi:hypothetical protein
MKVNDQPNTQEMYNDEPPNGQASAARQPSKRMLNFGSWAGRLHAVLGAACGTRALPADLSPNLQSIRRVRVRF